MTSHSGRHRPDTRAARRAQERRRYLPKSLTPRYALPTAAAAALVLTAAGATVSQPNPFADAGQEIAAVTDDSHDASGPAEPRSKAPVTSAVEQRRTWERQRAQRSKERQERADDRTWAAQDEDSASDDTSGEDWVTPMKEDAVLTSPFGQRDGRLHAGLDYGVEIGTPLRAMGDGEVIAGGPMSGYGTYIDVEYTDGTVSRYGHLDALDADVGEEVEAGDVVALSGNTGDSTGPHLHLEIRPDGDEPIDPAGWLAERGID